MHARPGHRLRRAGRPDGHPRRDLPAELALRVDPGLHHGRRHAADRLPPAPGRRPQLQARPAAAPLLRQPPAGRRPESRHQRHRQHRPVAPAEPDPADHLAAHDRRRPDHDADDQPDPRGRVTAGRPGLARHHRPDHPALAAPVRRPVGVDRHAQRARRGDAHRARDREALRPPARGDRDLRRRERPAVRGQLPGPVHLGDHPAGADPRLEPELRRDRGHRRPACRQRPDEPRRCRGVHPVLAPVHVPDHPDREHRQRAAVGRRFGGARLRAARRGGGDPRPRRAGHDRADPRGPTARSPSRMCRSATSPTSR